MQDANEIIKKYDGFIRALAWNLGRVDVDDLVQEGRIAVVAALKHYDPSRGASFWTFARRTVLNAMIDLLRKESRESLLLFEDGDSDAVSDSPNAEESMIGIEERMVRTRKVADAFGALSPQEQSFVRKRFAGQSNQSIADEIGVSRETVRRVFNEAATTLRERVA